MHPRLSCDYISRVFACVDMALTSHISLGYPEYLDLPFCEDSCCHGKPRYDLGALGDRVGLQWERERKLGSSGGNIFAKIL